MKKNKLNNQDQIFKLEKSDDNYMFRSIKLDDNCISTTENTIGSKLQLKNCDKYDHRQLFNIREDPTAYYISQPDTDDLCIDTGGNSFGPDKVDIHMQKCISARDCTKNRRFEITENIKNNDNDHNHIKPRLQNLILSYIPKGHDPEDRASMRLPFGLAVRASGIHGMPERTQSSIWCPFIYNALKKAGVSVPESWTIYGYCEKLEDFEEVSEQLSIVPGWK